METVEVVIRLPKEDMETINDPKGKGKMEDNMESYRKMIQIADRIFLAIEKCTVLPKGHGKLIDSNVLWDAYQDLGQDFYEAFDFAEANAVIEADKEAEDGNI